MNAIQIIVIIIFEIIGLSFFFGFPIYAAIKVKKRGRKGWFLATIITTFFGFGWIVALFALKQPPINEEREMNTQVQCKKCNNTNVTTKKVKTVDRVTNRDVNVVNVVIAVLWLIIFAFFMYLEISGAVLPLYYFLIFLVLALVSVREIVIYFGAHKVKAFVYMCNSCKYEWTQREDDVEIPEQK